MLTNWVLLLLEKVWEVELCWDWDWGVVILLHRKVLQRRRNGGEGEEGRALGHKLNILDGLTNKIILMVTTLVILSV